MQFSLETMAALATIVGTATAVLALIQSSELLVLSGLFFVCAALGAVLYALQKRRALEAASTVIEGHSIDSLNVASLRGRVNRKLIVQEAHQVARIEGEDLEITWRYSGFCKGASVSAFEFSVNSDKNTPFAQLKCVAYDLGHDPELSHAIQPMLIGPEGLSKLISVPFLRPLSPNERFEVMFRCTLPGCVNFGVGYYASTSSFAQNRVTRFSVKLQFSGTPPDWVRVYEHEPNRAPVLVKTLAALRTEPGLSEYHDVGENRPGQLARVYMFWRDPL